MISDYFTLAIRNLQKRRLRSWLTMAGIFIAMAAVFVLISLSLGLQNAIGEEFRQLGTDKFFIMPNVMMIAGPGSADTGFTIKDAEVVEKVSGVKRITYIVLGNAAVKHGDTTRFLQVAGIPTDKTEIFSSMEQYKSEEGRFFVDGDTEKVVLGNTFKTPGFYNAPLRSGEKISVNNHEFKVQGILKTLGNPSDDKLVLMTFDDFREVFGTGDKIDEIVVQVDNGADIKDVADRVQRTLLKHRNLKEKNRDFTISTPEELLESFGTILNIVAGFLLGIAAISLLVGGLGIANTMYTSVLERTKEIGTMKAVGAQNKDILLIFLIESGLLGMLGGAIGILFGLGISKSIEFIAASRLGTDLLQAAVPVYLVVGCLLFAFIVGAVSGIWPAHRASKLNTVDALRYE